jgi:redox-sensitive bicupin YhaK (pirin superfamily)
MIRIRRSNERGHAQHGWLDSHHTFSFADYYDTRFMGFRSLRVINEDRIQPSRGFSAHSHRDMEILTYVVDGGLEHQDSLGNGSVIRPGDVQRMSAGTGVTHSEYNHSDRDLVHLLQIWVLPEATGIEPSYEQRNFPPEERRGRLRLVASRDAREGSVALHQDVDLYATIVDAGDSLEHQLRAGRGAWVQVVRGAIEVGGERAEAGDGVAIVDEPLIALAAEAASEALLFDLA